MDERYAKARSLSAAVKKTQWERYQRDPNIVGVAFGRRIVGGEFTDDPAVVVYVARKVPTQFLPTTRVLPRRMFVGGDQIELDVVETGPIYPLEFTKRERPAPSGISIGHPAITAGTLGCLVTDNTDGSLCILSNNHVLANQNAAAIGDPAIQPGSFDGGTTPADDIGTLKRFVVINPTGNTVDGAIAQVTNPGDVVDQMKDNLMPVPNPNHPAIGLLFAGSCNRTIMNPIRDVLAQLDIQFPAGPSSIAAADIGMNVEKVGRTTEYTTSTVAEIDVTVTIDYDFGPATFDDQIATAWMSDGGDSGSIVCLGGAGGNEDHCDCQSVATAAQLLGVDLSLDQAVEKEFRERHLSQTRIGRYAIDLYLRNEARLVNRATTAKIAEAERPVARELYDKYIEQVRVALLAPNRADLRLTEEHLQDARQALERAKRYMTQEEASIADELFELASQAQGRTVREMLEMLNDEALYQRVRELVARIEFLEQPPER